jgi:hypothetical protein
MSNNSEIPQNRINTMPQNTRKLVYSKLSLEDKGVLKTSNRFFNKNVEINKLNTQIELQNKFNEILSKYKDVIDNCAIGLFRELNDLDKQCFTCILIRIGEAINKLLSYPQDFSNDSIREFFKYLVSRYIELQNEFKRTLYSYVDVAYDKISNTLYDTRMAYYVSCGLSLEQVKNKMIISPNNIKRIESDIKKLSNIGTEARKIVHENILNSGDYDKLNILKQSTNSNDKKAFNALKRGNSIDAKYREYEEYLYEIASDDLDLVINDMAEKIIDSNIFIKFDFIRFCFTEDFIKFDEDDNQKLIRNIESFYYDITMTIYNKYMKFVKNKKNIITELKELEEFGMDDEDGEFPEITNSPSNSQNNAHNNSQNNAQNNSQNNSQSKLQSKSVKKQNSKIEVTPKINNLLLFLKECRKLYEEKDYDLSWHIDFKSAPKKTSCQSSRRSSSQSNQASQTSRRTSAQSNPVNQTSRRISIQTYHPSQNSRRTSAQNNSASQSSRSRNSRNSSSS